MRTFKNTAFLVVLVGVAAPYAKADCDQCPPGSTVLCTVDYSSNMVYCTNSEGITIKTPRVPPDSKKFEDNEAQAW